MRTADGDQYGVQRRAAAVLPCDVLRVFDVAISAFARPYPQYSSGVGTPIGTPTHTGDFTVG